MPASAQLRTSGATAYKIAMTSRECIAGRLADEWLAMMSKLPWHDLAIAIRRHGPLPCGETTSLPTEIGLLDVSDSCEWVAETDGAIRLTIEVFDSPDDSALAFREMIVEWPGAR